MDARTPRFRFPAQKISETLLHFAEPILEHLTSEAPVRRVEEALLVACTVWNAVVFADAIKDQRYLNEIRRIGVDKPEFAALTEHLIARKRALFRDDERTIGKWDVSRKSGALNLRAEARNPHTLPRSTG